MAKKKPQLKLIKSGKNAFGGELMKTREGRSRPRPLDTKHTMHMVLRSSKAVGDWSFKRSKNEKKTEEIVTKFAVKYGVKLITLCNVGNHLHLQIKLTNRYTYRPFIRAITSAIAMSITGVSRWNTLKARLKFWDYRPFTRVIQSYRGLLNLKDYLEINQLEGFGATRDEARFIVNDSKLRQWKYSSA